VQMLMEAVLESLGRWNNATIMMKVARPLWKNESQASAATTKGPLIGEGGC
jgi:hypothetical protein